MIISEIGVYKFFEHTSDLEVRVESETFEELLKDSIKAVTNQQRICPKQ